MEFATINQLVWNTKGKINQLNQILDVLLSNYRTAAELIGTTADPRQTYLDQLLELNETLSDIVDTHPASVGVDKIWQCATAVMTSIAMEEQQINGKIK